MKLNDVSQAEKKGLSCRTKHLQETRRLVAYHGYA